MAYVTPTNFADGNTPTHTQLNVYSANLEWFQSISEYTHAPWITQAIGSQHYMLRKHRYLHWRYSVPAGGEYDNFIKVFVNGNQVGLHDDGGELVGPTGFISGVYDFNSGAVGTSLNNYYLVTTSYDAVIGNHGKLWFILESPLASAP
jgi:hypothetical protein